MNFPDDIALLVFQYLPYSSRINFVCSCSSLRNRWMNSHVRHIILGNQEVLKCASDEQYLQKVFSFISDPGTQLDCNIQVDVPTFPFTSVNKLRCSGSLLQQLPLHQLSLLRVSQLSCLECGITRTGTRTFEESLDMISLTSGLEELDLSLYLFKNRSFSVTDLPRSLKRLRLLSAKRMDSLRGIECFNRLHKLNLSDCEYLTDVSMLGNIPDLSIEFCDSLADISCLNDNKRVRMIDNRQLQDYSNSFANSEGIEIQHNSDRAIINLATWKKVKCLKFSALTRTECVELVGNNTCIPESVRKCSIAGDLIQEIDWPKSCRQLKELHLEACDYIKSLSTFGLEKIPVLSFQSLNSLTSLEGIKSLLNGGRNQVVSITSCFLLEDFSALRSVPYVTIVDCRFFRNIESLKGFKNLRISDLADFRLPDYQFSDHHLESFSINELVKVAKWNGLEDIPELRITAFHVSRLKEFLDEGNMLQNRKITISCYKNTVLEDLRRLYQEYLEPDYFFIQQIPDYFRIDRSCWYCLDCIFLRK